MNKINGTPSKFVKLPIPVSAYQWWRVSEFCENEKRDVHPYTGGGASSLISSCNHCGEKLYAHGWIKTLEGGHIVCPSDWIITGIAGEKYPCKNAIFKESYEPFCPIKHKR